MRRCSKRYGPAQGVPLTGYENEQLREAAGGKPVLLTRSSHVAAPGVPRLADGGRGDHHRGRGVGPPPDGRALASRPIKSAAER